MKHSNLEINKDIKKENVELKQLVKEMISGINKDTNVKNEMMEQLKEQSKIIQEMLPRVNNNKFNINIFLNEHCRGALNMSEFIESLQIHTKDLCFTKEKGLTAGVSTILLNKLKQLDTFDRPIHCTDIKREILYIKDNNEWNKDCENKR